MAMLLGLADKIFWAGTPTISTNTSYFDSSRVPYAYALVDLQNVSLIGNHPAPSDNVVWYVCRYYSDTGTGLGEDGYLAKVKDSTGNSLIQIDMIDGKPYIIVYGDSTVSGAATTQFSAGFSDFRVKVTVAATAISAEIWLNGVLVSSASATNNSGKGVARYWSWTPVDTIWGITMFSEFGVYDTEPTTNRFTKLSPSTNGTDTDLLGIVSNLSDNNLATSLVSDATNQKSSWNIDTYSNGSTISEFSVSALVIEGIGYSSNFRFYLLIGGVKYNGVTQTITANSSETVSDTWTLDPSDSTAWTATKINNTQVGFESVA